MLAYLDGKKVKVNNKETSLLEALTIDKYKSSLGDELYRIKIKDNTTSLDNKEYNDNSLFNDKLSMKEFMHKSLSNFSEEDKGKIHRNVAGRFIAQFRQWMPKFFTERFKNSRYNVTTGNIEEGYYNTFAKYIAVTIKEKIAEMIFRHPTKVTLFQKNFMQHI